MLLYTNQSEKAMYDDNGEPVLFDWQGWAEAIFDEMIKQTEGIEDDTLRDQQRDPGLS